MANDSTGRDTLIIPGGNNQFVVTYAYGDGSSSGPAVPAFGAVGSLNNTNPDFDFKALDNGKVYTVLPGESSPTISGGIQQFTIQYILPPGTESAGGYGVQVDGGNNTFVIANNVTMASDAAGNTVSVNGGNNAYVVTYLATMGTGGVSLSGPGIAGSGNQTGVIAGTPGNNSVNVDGGNNQYVVDYGNAASGGFDASAFMPAGGSMSGSVTTTAAPAGAPSTLDLTALLKMSPFGRILDIPGVTPDQLIAGFASATAGNGAGGSNPFAGATPGTNPFAGGFGGFGGGGTTPAPTPTSPGAGGSAPVAANPNYTYDFGAFASPGSGSGSAPAIPAGAAPSAGQIGSLLEQSPFGALLNIPGFTVEDLTNAFSSAGGNPFGGNPASFDPTAGTVPASNPFAAGVPTGVAAMAQSFFGEMASGSTPAEAFATFQNTSDLGQIMLAGMGDTAETTIPAFLLANT